uniref:Rev protein n=1 Tax=Equine infectious anemia virus TaxID=11665 RepID=A0A6C0WZ84_9RETR|nr:rev protein [Equine infectious anemia virus]
MAEGRDPRDRREMNLKEDPEEKARKRNNDWWKIDPQKPLDNDEWCRILRQSLPEEETPSETCMERRILGPGPVQCTPSRRNRWIRGQIQQAEILQEKLQWRIKGVQQTAQELGDLNRRIRKELDWTRAQHGDYSSFDGYRRDQERRWGQCPTSIGKPGDSKRRRKHL